jgi:hypothetical protein
MHCFGRMPGAPDLDSETWDFLLNTSPSRNYITVIGAPGKIDLGSHRSNCNLRFDRVVVGSHSLAGGIEQPSARQRLHIGMNVAVIALECLG